MGWWERLTLAPVVALWVIVLYRLRGTLYGGSRRLAMVLLALATMLTIRMSPVGNIIDETFSVTGLQVLVRDSLGVIMSVCAALAVADVVREPVSGRAARRWAAVATLVIVAMTAAFIAVGPERHGVLHMGADSGEPAALTYWSLFVLAYGSFIGAVVVMAARESRRPAAWSRGRTGLLLFGIGAAFTVVYLLAKAVVLVAAATGQYEHPFVANAATVQAIPSAVAIFFIVAGAACWLQLHLRERYLHWRLARPWAELTQPVPAVVLDPPLRNPPARLNRRMHEIREAAALLTSHLHPRDAEAARAADGVPVDSVLLELGRLRAAGSIDKVPPGAGAVEIVLPTDPDDLVRFFATRRRAERAALELTHQ